MRQCSLYPHGFYLNYYLCVCVLAENMYVRLLGQAFRVVSRDTDKAINIKNNNNSLKQLERIAWPSAGDGGIGLLDPNWGTPGNLRMEPGEDQSLSGV